MAERKNLRARKAPLRVFPLIKWILVAVLAAGIAFLFTAKPVFNIDILEHLKRDRSTSGSDAILTRAHDLFLFQTVEYVYKTVFPFDFVPAVYNWNELLDREARGNELTEEEQEYLIIYRFCEELGIKLRANKFDFVVITSVIRGGFDIEETAYADEYVQVDVETKTLFLRLPPPVITHFEIEDPDRATYPYPDFEISPENWKRLIRFTSAKIERQVLDDGILEHAKQNGKAFIEKLLIDSGLRHVVFLDPL
jgi:hypothetical protein